MLDSVILKLGRLCPSGCTMQGTAEIGYANAALYRNQGKGTWIKKDDKNE